MTTTTASRAIALTAPCAACVLLFQQVIADLVRDWWRDGNYSHGFVIAPVAAYLVWQRRRELMLPPAPSLFGVFVVIASLGLFVVGQLGAELFLSRVALVGAIAGAVLFLAGRPHLRALVFPLTLLLLTVPLPAIVFNEIALPLQLLASRLGVAALSLTGVPVLREGNVIVLSHTTLQVAEACSGIRSLMSLITLGILYSYFIVSRAWRRIAVVASTIPIAIAMNAVRIAGVGLGDRVAVIGMGMVGQLIGQLARLQGARIIAIDLRPETRVPRVSHLLPRRQHRWFR